MGERTNAKMEGGKKKSTSKVKQCINPSNFVAHFVLNNNI